MLYILFVSTCYFALSRRCWINFYFNIYPIWIQNLRLFLPSLRFWKLQGGGGGLLFEVSAACHRGVVMLKRWPLKRDFIAFKMKISSMWKRIVDMDAVNDVTHTHQSVITRVVKRFLWHYVIHWITATSYDKCRYPTGILHRNVVIALYSWSMQYEFLGHNDIGSLGYTCIYVFNHEY